MRADQNDTAALGVAADGADEDVSANFVVAAAVDVVVAVVVVAAAAAKALAMVGALRADGTASNALLAAADAAAEGVDYFEAGFPGIASTACAQRPQRPG